MKKQIERTFAIREDGTRELLDVTTHYLPETEEEAEDLGRERAFVEGHRWELERKAQAEKNRGRRSAANRKRKRQDRDRAIGDFAVHLAGGNDHLRDNPKAIASAVLERWKQGWGGVSRRILGKVCKCLFFFCFSRVF